MDTENPINDPLDTELQTLFAAALPAVGFEDRLVHAVQQHRRWRVIIPTPIYKAAIAAAAVLVVGTVGYYGNCAINGDFGKRESVAMSPMAAPTTQPGEIDGDRLDFGGGANTSLNWTDASRGNNSGGFRFDNPFGGKAANAWLRGGNTIPASESGKGILKSLSSIDPPVDEEKKGQPPLTGPTTITRFDHNHSILLPVAADGRTQNLNYRPSQDYFLGDSVLQADRKQLQPPDQQKLSKAISTSDEIGGKAPSAALPGVKDDTTVIADALGKAEKAKGAEELGLPAAVTVTTQPTDDRKIIRTGTMEFEVDRFDTAQLQITKIVNEVGGFVGTTDSQKLPNGKVRGSISVRVPPERLDALVMSLRALGDLKNQQISAQDITKEYTDLESELAADRAMQDRLLELIKSGKGSIKDLLAAENELGTWRTKIEHAEGQIRYFNGQVSLSTLLITLSEKDIQTPATAVETETADVGIEAEDVEKARNSALKAIDDAKGRIVEAELKRLDAGQLAARLVADVPPEASGALIDQLKQLGKVARLEVHRQQTTTDGSSTTTATTPLRTERKPTQLLISIYNLANVAPRRTTTVDLAATDVESAYAALMTAAKSNGGRVVTSSLDRGDPIKATGSLVLELPPEKIETAMTALHAQGEVLKLAMIENPDTQNSTEAKQGLTVQLVSLASVPAREAVQQSLATTDVPGMYQAILSAANAARARVQSAQLNEQDRQNVTADVQLEIARDALPDLDKAMSTTGQTIARTASRSAEAAGTVDSKIQLHLMVQSADHLAPRETTRLQVEVMDVDKAAADIQTIATTTGGRVLDARVSKDHGKGSAQIALDLPLNQSNLILQQIRNQGTLKGIDSSRDPQAPTGPLAHAQIMIAFTTPDTIVADQTGPWASIRQGLSTSVAGLMWSLQWVVVGMCLIGPWAAIGWAAWRTWKKIRRTKSGLPKFEERNLEDSNQ